MKATELRDILNRMAENTRDFDQLEVTVVTKDPSVGGRSKVPVKEVSKGIDWDNGHLLIWSEEPLVKKK